MPKKIWNAWLPENIIICDVMPSIVRDNFHLRFITSEDIEPEVKNKVRDATFCGLPARNDFHFKMNVWGQAEMGLWCNKCFKIWENIKMRYLEDK